VKHETVRASSFAMPLNLLLLAALVIFSVVAKPPAGPLGLSAGAAAMIAVSAMHANMHCFVLRCRAQSRRQ
jgi:hypothetical protein